MRKHGLSFILSIFLLNSCATFAPQYLDETNQQAFPSDRELDHSFYLIGDGGNSTAGSTAPAIMALKEELKRASKNSTVLFLGDNVYPDGMPKKGDPERALAEHQLNVQTDMVNGFVGKTMFIPGNHDWYSDGLKGLERQQKYIEDKLDSKKVFYPEDGCPISVKEINDDVVVIVIDTQWYLTNWDDHPTINDGCEIKTRTKFFEELEGLIKKNRSKTTLLATHHPMFTNGVHGGQYSIGRQFLPAGKGVPVPVLGSLLNLIRKTGGVSPQDLQNKRYREMRKRIVTLAQESEKVILVSGHEHSLQYIKKDNTPQIVSGAGSKKTATRNVDGGLFSYGNHGFARLDVFNDGSSYVRFFSVEDEGVKQVFGTEVLAKDKELAIATYANTFPPMVKASVYSDEEVDKTGFYKSIWGERYRKYYATKVNAPTVNLDTLFGGLTPVRKGGGHQSKSLRLVDKNGKGYVMRALRKSAEIYLQAMAFKDQYIVGEFEDTYTESLLQDFYTGAHPYAPFTTGVLSDAVDLYHTNPTLYYIPKQAALAGYNTEFGNELYMIEEHVSDGHGDLKSFGNANTIESTDNLLKKLRKDEKYEVDANTYLRARLFDMVIGDWDRHVDQWRWAEFKDENTGKVVYKAIPRDRDQVFSIMGDGGLMKIATRIIPPLKLMEGFMENVRNVKGFNSSPYSLDMIMLNETNRKQWSAQVAFIQKNLTAEVIDAAFKSFPEEVRDETVANIKRVLLSRIKNLPEIANDYYDVINKFTVIRGTDKDDWFDIERLPNGETRVTAYRIKGGKKAKEFYQTTRSSTTTKEIWVYGLDDDDVFKVYGDGDKLIKVRIVGGQNKDIYNIVNGAKVKVYDYKSKKSEFVTNKGGKELTDDYEANIYDYTKLKNNLNQLIPSIGSNPDDGFKIGITNTYTVYGFVRNPFTSQHTINAQFYFATNGFDVRYTGEFAKAVGSWNLRLEAMATSPNYSINFFGFGNVTENLDDDLGLDYNRVRLSTLKVAPSLVWRGDLGGEFKVGISYESIEVEETTGRFINIFLGGTGEVTEKFYGADATYSFKNHDNEAFPALGMMTSLNVGYRANADDTDRSFAYVIPTLGFDYKLVPSGQLVLATKAKAHITLGDDFEFYQAASIGASDGLRGYRNQRFTGKSALYQNTDLRLNLRKIKSGLLPLNIGIYGGFDYGKVWIDNDPNDDWNTSVGGGIFINGADILSVNLSVFTADDGGRFAFGLGFGF